jgi:hypothetical protein
MDRRRQNEKMWLLRQRVRDEAESTDNHIQEKQILLKTMR